MILITSYEQPSLNIDLQFSTFGLAIFQDLITLGYISSNAEKLMLKERGYIYSTKHEGWYSVSDEAFYPESAVQLARDPFTGRVFTVGINHCKGTKTGSALYRLR